MKEIQNNIFGNPGATIKKICKVIFTICVVVGGLTLLVGVVHLFSAARDWDESIFEMLSYTAIDVLGGSERKLDGYNAKAQILQGIYIVLAGLGTIPMYGLGCVVEDVAAIKKASIQKEDQTATGGDVISQN